MASCINSWVERARGLPPRPHTYMHTHTCRAQGHKSLLEPRGRTDASGPLTFFRLLLINEFLRSLGTACFLPASTDVTCSLTGAHSNSCSWLPCLSASGPSNSRQVYLGGAGHLFLGTEVSNVHVQWGRQHSVSFPLRCPACISKQVPAPEGQHVFKCLRPHLLLHQGQCQASYPRVSDETAGLGVGISYTLTPPIEDKSSYRFYNL